MYFDFYILLYVIPMMCVFVCVLPYMSGVRFYCVLLFPLPAQ